MGIGCVEARALLEPGPSFCWGPALEGSTSPSSWFFYTLGKVEVDKIHRRQVLRSRALPTPARASATPPTRRSRTFTPPSTARAPLPCLTSTLLPFALVSAQELNFAVLLRPRSMVAHRGGAAAAALPVRAGRALWHQRGGEGRWVCAEPEVRRANLAKYS